jgi:hypothetical protein
LVLTFLFFNPQVRPQQQQQHHTQQKTTTTPRTKTPTIITTTAATATTTTTPLRNVPVAETVIVMTVPASTAMTAAKPQMPDAPHNHDRSSDTESTTAHLFAAHANTTSQSSYLTSG